MESGSTPRARATKLGRWSIDTSDRDGGPIPWFAFPYVVHPRKSQKIRIPRPGAFATLTPPPPSVSFRPLPT